MTVVFQDHISIFMHVYLDNIFVYSNTIEEHEKHLRLIFDQLCEVELYLKQDKCDLYSKKLDCLGHVIDNKGIHTDKDKMALIWKWPQPHSKNDIEQFNGMVKYMSNHMSGVTEYLGSLNDITKNGHPFAWRPLHQWTFEGVKNKVCKYPVIQPIDPVNTRSKGPIWLVCDPSISRLGAMYGQGKDWGTCRPARFMSKKLSDAQHNYPIVEISMSLGWYPDFPPYSRAILIMFPPI